MGKQPTPKVRKNRLKKTNSQSPRPWPGRLLAGLKPAGLLGLLAGTSWLFMLAYGALTTSAYFNTSTITVSGNHQVTRQELLAQAQMKTGDNLLALNLKTIRRRLLAHPWIAAARVSRQIPRTVTIFVEEQKPLAVLDLGTKYLVNNHGRIFKAYENGDPDHLPLITGIGYSDLSLGSTPLSPAMETIMEVLTLSKSSACAIPYSGIAVLHLDKETGITLTLKEGRQVIKLGTGRFEEKNRNLGRLFRYLKQNPQWRDYAALDVHNPERIVLQPNNSSQENSKGA